MTLGECLRVLRTRWRVAVAVTVLGVVVAGLIATLMPPSYTSKVDVFFTSSDPTTNVADRVAGYAPLMTNDFVTSAVVGQLRLPETPQQFAQHVSVTSQPNSAVLTATVTLPDPAQASAAANAVANSFIDLFGRLEVPLAPNTLPAVSAKLVQPAGPPVAAAWPSALTLLVGLAVGLVLGAAAAGLRHALDPKVRSRDELVDLTGRPVLGEVTTSRRADVIGRSSSAPVAEFGRLRTVLRRMDGSPRTFTISGATDVASITTVSVNLASALALARATVLLVEADLRHPRISHLFGLDTRTGLTSVLSGTASLEQAVRPGGTAGLWVLPAGTVEDDSGDLLGSPRMAELLSEVREEYDVVVLDTAPLLDEASAVELAASTDGVVLLVGRGSTRKQAVREAAELLDQLATPLLGTVLSTRSRRRAGGGEPGGRTPETPTSPETPIPSEGPAPSAAPAPTAPTAAATVANRYTPRVPSKVPSPSKAPSPSPSPASASSRSSAPVGTTDPSETTAETSTRSLISLRSAARGATAGSARAEAHDEDVPADRGARGDSAVPATENGPTG